MRVKTETTIFPMYIMLIGFPCTGKSTWRKWMEDALKIHDIPLTVASADDLTYALRDELNNQHGYQKQLCYADMFFSGHMKVVRERFDAILHAAKKQNNGIIIIDTTNLNPELRKKLIQETNSNNVHALYFRIQDEDSWKMHLLRRNQSTEQIIPMDCIAKMKQNFEEPHEGEFNSVSVCPSLGEPGWENSFYHFIDTFIEKYNMTCNENSQIIYYY